MGKHIDIAISPSGDEAVVWVAGDVEDALRISGRPDSVDAICRALRGNESAVEHELSQRGARREPFVSDEIPESAKAPSVRVPTPETTVPSSSTTPADDASSAPPTPPQG